MKNHSVQSTLRARLFRRRSVICPTAIGWICVLLSISLLGAIFFGLLFSFLHVNDPIESDVLVVEGWVDDDSVEVILDLMSAAPNLRIVTTGVPLTHWSALLPHDNYADLARASLIGSGAPAERVFAAPAPETHRNRTAGMALALKAFMQENGIEADSVNIFTQGVHARRSRDIYRAIMQPEYEVGVLAIDSRNYTAQDWWKSSEGVRSVLSESIAYVYNCAYLTYRKTTMDNIYIYVAGGLLAYLLGSIPFGFLIGKAKGVDVRKVGSGNIGATNVFRTVGRGLGIVALLLDFLKGLIAATLIPLAASAAFDAPTPYLLGLACGVAAVLGHNYSLYLKFRGGKGIATSAGMLAGIAPIPFVCGITVFILVFVSFKYVSLGSITAALAVIPAGWIWNTSGGNTVPTVLTGICILVIARHHSNIRRLLNGTENRAFGRGARK